MKDKLAVAFLWHMHQPLYKDLVSGKYYLPWVRLHSTYSYLDMVSILEKFPSASVTFNFTPCLIWQLLDISRNNSVDDVFLQLSEKKAEKLTDEDKVFILKNFFSCDIKRSILTNKRYHELFLKRGESVQEKDLFERLKYFKISDFRDVQLFFNLAWCGFTLREKNALVRKLIHKGHDYTEDDKKAFFKLQNEVVASILPAYKHMQDKGQIEISTSPFYHPILPLLCDKEETLGMFAVDDAKNQVRKAIALYKEVFGTEPRGFWPPEGSVSQAIIPLLREEKIKWIATDEGILWESLNNENVSRDKLLYQAFSAYADDKNISIIFRDVGISNAISFRYSGMPAKKAVMDIMSTLKNIKNNAHFYKKTALVSIILDGENPWPYFSEGGKLFLSEMYRQISENKDFGMVTVSRYLENDTKTKKIDNLFSGSWIDRNFNKWTGSPQKKRAWKYLKKAKEELVKVGWPNPEALEELYIAEGSDWFWWYDDFGSELNFIFDELYRIHLSNIYRLIDKPVPYYLKMPVPAGPAVNKLVSGETLLSMARVTKILIVASEAVPFAKTGGLADVTTSLAKALLSLGCDVRIVLPCYTAVRNNKTDLKKELSRVKNVFATGDEEFDVYCSSINGVPAYFIHNEKYFAREELYGTEKGDYSDNALRFGFFSQAVLSSLKHLDFVPDVIHCNDWQTALIPFYLNFYLKKQDDTYQNTKSLFSIHNMAYQGVFDRKIMKNLNIPDHFFNMNDLEFYGKLNFMKSGILYSDAVSTVSFRYAEEIMTPEYGAGLDGLLMTKKESLYGIPNGADYSIWSPETDIFIKTKFNSKTLEKKLDCKKELIDYARLKIPLGAPLLGCITRLVEQKGMDLVADIMGKVISLGCGIVILGKGTDHYNKLFSALSKKYAGKLYLCSAFNDELAHKIEAGCDIFLMPSRYEPCGLNQMYSIKYGTIPVVRATGGLDDAIRDFDEDREAANGFKFAPATSMALYEAVKRAVELFNKDKKAWKKLMISAMSYNYSWDKSAKQYLTLYRKIMTG
ncbi:MAG: glycogen synthase GlgA [Candidatus Omnitrophota bacterium]|nr:glycogen synthase GlgA [Candidatus Omnitrophota bacterium]